MPLKYLSNFWKSLDMPLINCNLELNLKWAKYCALSADGAENANDNSNNISFTIKYTKLYVPVVTLSTRDNQKLSRILSKGFERSAYWNDYKQNVKIKLLLMNIDIFSNQMLLESID